MEPELLAIEKFMEKCNFHVVFDTFGGSSISAKCRKHGDDVQNIYLAIDDGILKLKVVEIGRSIPATEPCFVCGLADPSCFSRLEKILAEL